MNISINPGLASFEALGSSSVSQSRTFGVEEELLIVHPVTGRPLAAIGAVLSALSAAKNDRSGNLQVPAASTIEAEVKQEQLEVISAPFSTLDSLYHSLLEGRRFADAVAQTIGARTVALATSVLPVDSSPTPRERNREMSEQFGLTFNEQLTCGFHVHVSVSDREEGVAVLDRIRPWLPAFLSLSANSPFWMGEDTGFASFRYQAWNRWPSSGCYDLFGSLEAYQNVIDGLVETGVLLDRGMVYFDARLSEKHPTVEIRLADVCLEAKHAALLAALARGLVQTAADEWQAGKPPDAIPTAILRLAAWRASRFGLRNELISPLSVQPCSSEQTIEALYAHVEAALTQYDDKTFVELGLQEILNTGNGAEFQREAFQRFGDLRPVVHSSIDVSNQGR